MTFRPESLCERRRHARPADFYTYEALANLTARPPSSCGRGKWTGRRVRAHEQRNRVSRIRLGRFYRKPSIIYVGRPLARRLSIRPAVVPHPAERTTCVCARRSSRRSPDTRNESPSINFLVPGYVRVRLYIHRTRAEETVVRRSVPLAFARTTRNRTHGSMFSNVFIWLSP